MRTALSKHIARLVAAALLTAAASAPASAALAPKVQRLNEMHAALRSAANALKDPVERIEYYGDDVYKVWGGRCWLEVKIVGTPAEGQAVGPRQFNAEPGEVECDIPVNE